MTDRSPSPKQPRPVAAVALAEDEARVTDTILAEGEDMMEPRYRAVESAMLQTCASLLVPSMDPLIFQLTTRGATGRKGAVLLPRLLQEPGAPRAHGSDRTGDADDRPWTAALLPSDDPYRELVLLERGGGGFIIGCERDGRPDPTFDAFFNALVAANIAPADPDAREVAGPGPVGAIRIVAWSDRRRTAGGLQPLEATLVDLKGDRWLAGVRLRGTTPRCWSTGAQELELGGEVSSTADQMTSFFGAMAALLEWAGERPAHDAAVARWARHPRWVYGGSEAGKICVAFGQALAFADAGLPGRYSLPALARLETVVAAARVERDVLPAARRVFARCELLGYRVSHGAYDFNDLDDAVAAFTDGEWRGLAIETQHDVYALAWRPDTDHPGQVEVRTGSGRLLGLPAGSSIGDVDPIHLALYARGGSLGTFRVKEPASTAADAACAVDPLALTRLAAKARNDLFFAVGSAAVCLDEELDPPTPRPLAGRR